MSAGLGHHMLRDQPAAEVNCHFGFHQHHATFALLYLAMLGWFLYSAPRSTPGALSGLIAACIALIITVHALLGGVCGSPAIAMAVHVTRLPLYRILWLLMIADSLAPCAVAAHFSTAK